MKIRKADYQDLPRMQEIFAIARSEMKKNGNPNQWKDDRPPLFLIEKDFSKGVTYVIEDEDKVIGTFSYTIGVEPTYVDIYDGKWLNDLPYGTIHRIASDTTHKGIFKYVLDFVETFGVDIRIDTHPDNKIMLHLMDKYGFTKCGIIYIDDGTSRIAFQKIINKD